MHILVIGSGGREHALAWKIAQSPKVAKVWAAPGNAGMTEVAECVQISASDIRLLADFAEQQRIDLSVVGPELPLTLGVVDEFERRGLRIFGPRKDAAIVEGSKVFAKSFMKKYHIPTGFFQSFDRAEEAKRYIREIGAPLVVKADGLAAGKGVIVCLDLSEALDAVNKIMEERLFGDAGERIVIEEYLEGEEVSFHALTDGETVIPLASSRDHKRVFNEDQGPTTGGMGAYSPAPIITEPISQQIMEQVMIPAVAGMATEGRAYKGILYAGLMISGNVIKVLEFNARLGDPETQPLLVRMKSDLVPLLEAVVDGRLRDHTIDWKSDASVCVVMASKGYPGPYDHGAVITGIEEATAEPGIMIFHAGTSRTNDRFHTGGGRVLGVTGLGRDLQDAVAVTYRAVKKIHWEGAHYRTDIGSRAPATIMELTAKALERFEIPFELKISSAHRSLDATLDYIRKAEGRGIKVIIAGAGAAAHLAGVIAGQTTLPVIGVPLASTSLKGLDALLSVVQMPGGVPVATMAIGEAGAKNAGLLAARILALSDEALQRKLESFKEALASEVEEKDRTLQKRRP